MGAGEELTPFFLMGNLLVYLFFYYTTSVTVYLSLSSSSTISQLSLLDQFKQASRIKEMLEILFIALIISTCYAYFGYPVLLCLLVFSRGWG